MRTNSPRKLFIFAACCLASLLGCGEDGSSPTPTDSPDVYPAEDWAEAAPEAMGLNADRLGDLQTFFDPLRSSALLVVRSGYVVWERYWEPNTRETPIEVWSVSKSFTSAAAGVAVADGLFDPGQPAADFVAEWESPDPRSAITLNHLFSMTSGLQWSWLEYVPIGMMLFKLGDGDLLKVAIDKPLAYEPGTHWTYNNLACMVLSGVMARATGVELKEFARERVAGPIGMKSFDWMTDQKGHTLAFMGVSATARDLARFGYLFLRQGQWAGRQIVPADWVALSARTACTLNPAYGYLWWINGSSDHWVVEGEPAYRVPKNGPYLGDQAPADLFAATGAFGQLIVVVPEYDLVMVHTGRDDFYDYRDAINLLCADVTIK